jgi:hypothetical protein
MAYPMVLQVGKVGIVICNATSQWRTAMTISGTRITATNTNHAT